MNTNNTNTFILQFLAVRRMTGSPAEWNRYRKEQAAAIAGKIEKDKSQEFAEYIERCFISICDELHVFEMARDWAKKTAPEKLAVAGNIIKRFVERVQSDTQTGRAKKYNDMAVESVPKIHVARSDKGLMSVSSKGTVNINPNWVFYNDLVRFLMDLRHEATHIVDVFFPCLSPINPDILARAQIFYVDGHEDFGLYESNPLEVNANTRRDEFRDILRAEIALCECARVQRLAGNTKNGMLPRIPRGR